MAKTVTIAIQKMVLRTIKLKVVGKSPYLPEPMDTSVADNIDKKKANKTIKKDTRLESEKAKEKYYYTEDGKKGIPARAFYKAMVRASSYLIDKKQGGMRKVREGVIVKGDILLLECSKEEPLVHYGRDSGMTKAPRKIIRNAFYDWSTTIEVEFNEAQLSADQIVNILNWAGFHIGVGGFRKENSGNFGMFEVEG